MNSLSPLAEKRPQARRVWAKRTSIALPLLCLIIFGTVFVRPLEERPAWLLLFFMSGILPRSTQRTKIE